MDVLDEIHGLRADLAWFQSSSSSPPFDDRFCLPFGISSHKRGVHLRVFALVLVFVFQGESLFLLVGACGVVLDYI